MSTDNSAYQTRAWEKLVYFFGEPIYTEQLRSLAIVVNEYLKIGLTSEEKRTKANLIIWFDTHYNIIFPWMQDNIFITLRDGSTINLKDENE